jgi:hypothetical protein
LVFECNSIAVTLDLGPLELQMTMRALHVALICSPADDVIIVYFDALSNEGSRMIAIIADTHHKGVGSHPHLAKSLDRENPGVKQT